MRFFPKQFLILGALLFLPVFFSVLTAETGHHHGALESKDDCSLCSWQQSDSKAVTVTFPILAMALIVAVLFFQAFPVAPSARLISLPGRSPPVLL